MYDNLIIVKDKEGNVNALIAENHNGKKRGVKAKATLGDAMVAANNIEYLENKKKYLSSEIYDHKTSIKNGVDFLKKLKIAKVVTTALVFVVATAASMAVISSPLVCILITLGFTGVSYGIFEYCAHEQKNEIKNDAKQLKEYSELLTIVEEDLTSENSRSKITYDNKTNIEVIPVDKTELHNYQRRYETLINRENSVVEEKPKRKSYEYKPLNK